LDYDAAEDKKVIDDSAVSYMFLLMKKKISNIFYLCVVVKQINDVSSM
jgi:hypothetical protein